jgi:hypothetical protein
VCCGVIAYDVSYIFIALEENIEEKAARKIHNATDKAKDTIDSARE